METAAKNLDAYVITFRPLAGEFHNLHGKKQKGLKIKNVGKSLVIPKNIGRVAGVLELHKLNKNNNSGMCL